MTDWFFDLDPLVQAALVAAVVGLLSSSAAVVIKHFLDKRSLRNRLEAEFEYEQRRMLKAAIAEHLGTIIEKAERLDHRLWNLQTNQAKDWLAADGRYQRPAYYFRSMVYRFLALFAAIRAFFDDAVYIDPRYASGDDIHFIRSLKAFEWVMTDSKLFEGLDYDDSRETDHLFRGNLRGASELLLNDGAVIPPSSFEGVLASGVADDSPLSSVLRYFDGLTADEERYRWDRVVALHMLILAFMASFGYDMQRPEATQFQKIAATTKNAVVAKNLSGSLDKLGLTRHPAGHVLKRAIAKEFEGVRGIGLIRSMKADAFLERG